MVNGINKNDNKTPGEVHPYNEQVEQGMVDWINKNGDNTREKLGDLIGGARKIIAENIHTN